jgi:hypothetical protein
MHQTISARLVELEREGKIFNSGRTRTTTSGRKAIAWVSDRKHIAKDRDQEKLFPEEAKT